MKGFFLCLVALALLFTAACSSLTSVSLKENENPATRPAKIEVRSKGRTYVVYAPLVQGDSLHGWYDGAHTDPVAFVISDIERAEFRHFNHDRTAAAVIIGGAATALIVWIALIAHSGI